MSAGEPGQRVSRAVVDRFLDQLARGELNPGDRLPPERDLAAGYGVGRNSVREALRELELLGVVESRHGDGTYVTEVDITRLMEPFRMMLSLQSPRATIREILEFRRVIEPEAAALAAEHLDDETEALLRRVLQRFDRALDDHEDGAISADTGFHFAIARASKNPLIIAVQRALIDVLSEFRLNLHQHSYDPDQRLTRGHHAIFGAIVAGDPDAARDAMREHLRDVALAIPDELGSTTLIRLAAASEPT